jgi:hypothetical protein
MPVTIRTPSANGTSGAPLYTKFDDQLRPQRAFLEIDPLRRTAVWTTERRVADDVPDAVKYHVIRRVRCSPWLTTGDLARLSQELRPLVERVVSGCSRTWDGERWRGTATVDAQDALHALERRLLRESGDLSISPLRAATANAHLPRHLSPAPSHRREDAALPAPP